MLIGSPTATVIFSSTERKIKFFTQLGETKAQLLSVSTNKSLAEPTGTFQIQLTPEKDSQGATWFDKINVWDFVEISFKGILDKKEVTTMRGLVDSISFSENYAGDIPQRIIMISGRDLGCLLTDFQVYIIPELGERAAAEATVGGPVYFKAISEGFLGGNVYDFFKFLVKVLFDEMDLVVSDKNHITAYLDWDAAAFFEDLTTTSEHLKDVQQNWWTIFSQFQDKPFHEMFVYDADDMSWFIMRPSRLKDSYGHYPPEVIGLLGKDNMYPPDFSISKEEKISMSVSKSIKEMYNYYLSIPTLNIITKVDFRGQAIAPNRDHPELSKNPFFQLDEFYPSYTRKYGFRKYEFETVYMDLDIGQEKSQGKNYQAVTGNAFTDFGIKLNETLVTWFLHNPLLLSGTVSIPGTNRALIGTYMLDEDISENREFYVEGVNHSFITVQSFTTNLELSRGIPVGGLPIINKHHFMSGLSI